MNFDKSSILKKKSHKLIPGGCHTYAKGDDQYPELAPGFIVRGKGSHVWDADGNEFIEYGMGLRSVTLGHAYPSVVEAAYKQMLLGNNFTRPAPIEVECAEKLLGLLKNGEMVKFAKNGSDVTTAAVKLARAYTGKEKVAICADHPFFSTDDWFIGGTALCSGIPKVVKNLTVKFRYNDLESLAEIFENHKGEVACVVMEAATAVEPVDDYLQGIVRLCEKNGALFILDEIITGFRWSLGGAQKYYGIKPDLSCFGKAMANGFSLSALVGKREIMDLGGLDHNKDRVLLLSTTHGAENHCLAAAIETMEVYEKERVVDFLKEKGSRLAKGVKRIAAELKIDRYFDVIGNPANLVYVTRDQDMAPSQAFRALFLQETIKRGLLMPSMVISFSHTDEDVDKTIQKIGEALMTYRKALNEGVEKYLIGRAVKPVFRRFN